MLSLRFDLPSLLHSIHLSGVYAYIEGSQENCETRTRTFDPVWSASIPLLVKKKKKKRVTTSRQAVGVRRILDEENGNVARQLAISRLEQPGQLDPRFQFEFASLVTSYREITRWYTHCRSVHPRCPNSTFAGSVILIPVKVGWIFDEFLRAKGKEKEATLANSHLELWKRKKRCYYRSLTSDRIFSIFSS